MDKPAVPIGFPKRRPLPSGVKLNEPNKNSAHRAYWHDYCAPCVYLITATVAADNKTTMPLLSELPEADKEMLSKGEMIVPSLTSLGKKIKDEIVALPKSHPELEVSRFVVMPDHIHLLVKVKQRLKRMLGRELAGFLGACSRHYSEQIGSDSIVTLFAPFHDRIIKSIKQFDRAFKYIEDNPRRLMVKRLRPDLFRRRLHLEINGQEYGAYGNIFLLRQIYLLPVRVHRRWSDEEMGRYKEFCQSEFTRGAVGISPAIHPVEREIMNGAIADGFPVIRLTDRHFGERFKPSGREFDLCAKGRLLLLAPWQAQGGKKNAGHKEFHDMNDMALAISNLSAEARMRAIGTRSASAFAR